MSTLTQKEKDLIKKGQDHWKGIVPKSKDKGGFVTEDTLKYTIEKIVDDVWMNAKTFYEKKYGKES